MAQTYLARRIISLGLAFVVFETDWMFRFGQGIGHLVTISKAS